MTRNLAKLVILFALFIILILSNQFSDYDLILRVLGVFIAFCGAFSLISASKKRLPFVKHPFFRTYQPMYKRARRHHRTRR